MPTMKSCMFGLERRGKDYIFALFSLPVIDATSFVGSTRSTTALPLRPGCSTTLHKIHGATLEHLTIWLDVPFVRGAAYVALSRVRKDQDWQFLGAFPQETLHAGGVSVADAVTSGFEHDAAP